MSKLAQFLATSQEQQQQAAATAVVPETPPEPAVGRLSQFIRRVSVSRRSSTTATATSAPAAPTTTTSSSSIPTLDTLFNEQISSQPAFALAKTVHEWKSQGLFDSSSSSVEDFEQKTEGKTPADLAQDLADQVLQLNTALLEYKNAVEKQVAQLESQLSEAQRGSSTGKPPLSAPGRSSVAAKPVASSSPRHQTARPTPLADAAVVERIEPIVMNKFVVPVDLSNEATVDIQAILDRINQELESRGGFTGEVYTFMKRKDGNMLNRDNTYVGGKIASTFEFRSDNDRKTKTYFISSKCRGTTEPVEDLTSKGRDQSKYMLQFDPEDEHVIVGCYKI